MDPSTRMPYWCSNLHALSVCVWLCLLLLYGILCTLLVCVECE